MNKLIGIIFSIVLFLFLILMFINISDDYDKNIETEIFIAVSDTTVEEEFIVDYRVNEIIEIHVNNYNKIVEDNIVSINVLGDGSVILVSSASDIGDEVEIMYSYEIESEVYIGAFIDIIPLIMILILLGGIGFILIKGRN